MTTRVWRRTPLAAASCLGVLFATVVGLWAGWSALESARRQASPSIDVSSTITRSAWRIASAGDVDEGGSRPVVVPRLAREVLRGLVPTGAAAGEPALQLVLPCLVLGVLVVVGPRPLHPREGARRHGTRAPPAWS